MIVDVQGPYTVSEDGHKYVLSYHCVALRTPKLEPFQSLKAAHFGRALATCILRARVVPDVVRTDRGPEMTSRVNEEFLALVGADRVMGAASTPRHQGEIGRAHV